MTEKENFLAKAKESLAGAESELSYGRYNNTGSRAYYAVFQAGIAALLGAGISLTRQRNGRVSHSLVQSAFAGILIHRRKLYGEGLRNTLPDLMRLRRKVDYQDISVSEREAREAVRRAKRLVDEVNAKLANGGS